MKTYDWGFSQDGNIIVGFLLVILIGMVSTIISFRLNHTTTEYKGFAVGQDQQRDVLVVGHKTILLPNE